MLHGTVAKIFNVRERVKIRVEFPGNDVFNHPNWCDPNMVITDRGTAGVVTATMDRKTKFDSAIPREMQAQIRIMW